MKSLRPICLCIAALLTTTVAAFGQQFRLVVSQNGNSTIVQSGAAIGFNAPVGGTVSATITATYLGNGQATVDRPPTLLGSTAFEATLASATPLVLGPNNSFNFEIRYRPQTGSLSSAQFSLLFVETLPPSGTAPAAVTTGALTLSLQGTSPVFRLSYVLQADQNVVPLNPGDRLTFGATLVNTTGQAGLNVTNVGSGAGAITGISLLSGGEVFRLSRVPLFPFVASAGETLQVLVLYQPQSVVSSTGRVQITFASGPPAIVDIEGNGSLPALTYQLIQSSPPETVVAGGAVSIPPVAIGQTSSILMQVTNSGNAPGVISGVNVAGTGFLLPTPPLLPQTLAPNASLTFAVNFIPQRAGTTTGALVVNSDRFELRGVGLGANLAFSYELAGVTVTLDASNPAVVFTPVMISQSGTISLTVRNTGTLAATIANIGLAQADGPFKVSELPALPFSLAPGADIRVPITFTPTVTGFVNGTLRLDSTSVPLTGSGTAPPPLPGFTIKGPSGTVKPDPATVSLSLDAPYPIAITGSLTLGASSTLPPDPAVQFATGGTVARFSIPANTTEAIFGSQGSQLGLQTGTVAADFTLTPSFATQSGGVDLTPGSPSTLRFRIAAAAPVLLAVQVSGQSATGFTLTATGFSTTRSLTSMTIDLTPAPGVQLGSTKFTIDLQQIGSVWFRSTASQAFGGQFVIALPFTLQGTTSQAVLAAVTATVSNEVGASNAVQSRSQ